VSPSALYSAEFRFVKAGKFYQKKLLTERNVVMSYNTKGLHDFGSSNPIKIYPIDSRVYEMYRGK